MELLMKQQGTKVCYLPNEILYSVSMQGLEKYEQAIDSLLDSVNNEFEDNVLSVLIVGSWARGDFIPGQSDIDINIVMRTGTGSDHEKQIREIAGNVQNEFLSGSPQLKEEVIGTSVTTIEEIKSGSSYLGGGFVYYDFLNSSQVIFGEDIRNEIQVPSEDEIYTSAKDCIDGILNRYAFMDELLKLDLESANEHFAKRENMAELAFAMFFRGTSVFLAANGVYVSDKTQILNEINKGDYPDWIEPKLKVAYEYWMNWSNIEFTNAEIFDLLKMAFVYLRSLRSLI